MKTKKAKKQYSMQTRLIYGKSVSKSGITITMLFLRFHLPVLFGWIALREDRKGLQNLPIFMMENQSPLELQFMCMIV